MWILEDLYLGNVRPGERGFQRGTPYARAMEAVSEAEESLRAALGPEERDLLGRLLSAQLELSALGDCEAFLSGFKVGARVLMDVLSEEGMREI